MDSQFLAELVFPGQESAVSVVRQSVRHVLKAAGHQDTYDAEVIVSELVANAIKHTASGQAGGLVIASVAGIGNTTTIIEVIDQGAPTVPRMCEPADDECSGRGLYLVASLAAQWGVEGDVFGGRRVWAEVLTVESAPVVAVAASLLDVEP
ncbi:ATP-binding protein (plasmid) [Actinomadura sp. ATCC 31491]|uniref:ATP-binding protein n=1 Tax=Actinomadura luzonensis TaxID=2805427 RepID=A0ABT0GBS9_9ACTN|nr:ATP-binding protein [Actinomadura luzonensis]MCK2222021.1 ATP-binding protein [Actinomadura luzonensis]